MKIETLKRSSLKRNIAIGVIVVLIISAIILNFTRAKYRVTQSIPLVNGTINYIPYDFKIMAMYQESDSGDYIEIDKMPSSGYNINEGKSYCEVNGEKDNSTVLKTINGNHTFANLQKGTKCYLYFDVNKQITNVQELIASYTTVLTRDDFTITVTNTTTGTIYKSANISQYDNAGEVYYFAGNPTDNWVNFGGFYWRIIRINGDGTIRLIYQGTSANTTGSGTQIGTSAFNSSYDNNMYVGFKYTSGNVHGTGTNSTILNTLNIWYSNNLASFADDIDGNAGFCGDRSSTTSSSGAPNNTGGTGTLTTYYGARYRVDINMVPSFRCEFYSDLYTTSGSEDGNRALTYPIGLITADEVVFAGSGADLSLFNNSYYLHTEQSYWTMSPSHFLNGHYAGVYLVGSFGYLDYSVGRVTNSYGVRPVINLKADIQFSGGNGTSSNPYVVS